MTREPLGLAEVPERGDLWICRGGPPDYLIDRRPSLEDGLPKAGQEQDPSMRIGFVAYLLHRILLKDRRRAVAAGDGHVDELREERAFNLGLEELWRSPQAGPLLGGAPRARIVDIVETKLY